MIAIVAAMDVELKSLLEKLKYEEVIIANKSFYLALINNKRVVITKLGIGKVNASMTLTILFTNFDIDLVINTGIAGGLKPLNRNDIIISNKLYYSDADARGFGYKYGQIPGENPYFETSSTIIDRVLTLNNDIKIVNIASGDSFVTRLDQVSEILKVDETITVVDMESTAVAQVSSKFNKNFVIIRSISDIINDENQLLEYNEEESASIVQKLVLDIVYNY